MKYKDLMPMFEIALRLEEEHDYNPFDAMMKELYEDWKSIRYWETTIKEWNTSVAKKSILTLDCERLNEVMDYIAEKTATFEEDMQVTREILRKGLTIEELLQRYPSKTLFEWGQETV